MITSLDGQSHVGPNLRTEHLEPYWAEYFAYRDQAQDLHDLTETALSEVIASAKQANRPHIDSAIRINELLTALGSKHTFHRQFGERFPGARPAQVLGMQLYALIAADEETWTYMKTKHANHIFPHSMYFLSRQ